jgi:hypothetical protein
VVVCDEDADPGHCLGQICTVTLRK